MGDYAKIGAGAVVLKEVPPHCTVVGVPGHVVNRRDCGNCADRDSCAMRETMDPGNAPGEAGVDLDQVHLPDPVEMELTRLERRIAALEKSLRENAGTADAALNRDEDDPGAARTATED